MDSVIADPIAPYGELLDGLQCGALLLDRTGIIHGANERLCRMLHRSGAEIVGHSLQSLYTTEESAAVLREHLAAFDEPHEGECYLPDGNGGQTPVIVSGRLLGTAAPHSDYRLITLVDISAQKKADEDRKEELLTISRLSDTVLAQALELKRYNERLEERVRERTKELHEANMEAIYMLAIASEAKDADTGAHVRRIENLSKALARTLGLSRHESDRIGYSAILHDVGKMLVPDDILKKPGPLDGKERGTMQLHAAEGERILSRKPFFDVARQIARSHHENWDGSGYPDGLSGARIPVAARIVHLADVYDALTSQRVYKKAWPIEKAVDEIARSAGRLFDPDVVRAFNSLIGSGTLSTYRE